MVGILSDGQRVVLDDGTGAIIVDLKWLINATGENPVSQKGKDEVLHSNPEHEFTEFIGLGLYIMAAGHLHRTTGNAPGFDIEGIAVPHCPFHVNAFKCVDLSGQVFLSHVYL